MSSRTIDRVKKSRPYLELGARDHWVVDPDEGVVRQWDSAGRPDRPRQETDSARWTVPGAETALELDIGALVAAF